MRSGQILRFRQSLVLIPQFFHEQLKVVVKGLMQSQHPLTHFPESPVFPVGGINNLERGVFPFLVLIPFFPVGSRLLKVFAQGTVLPCRCCLRRRELLLQHAVLLRRLPLRVMMPTIGFLKRGLEEFNLAPRCQQVWTISS